VSKPFFPFARYLLNEIRLIVDVDQWKRRGNGVIESAARALEENETLTVMFLMRRRRCRFLKSGREKL
jgi:hypothetical protein